MFAKLAGAAAANAQSQYRSHVLHSTNSEAMKSLFVLVISLCIASPLSFGFLSRKPISPASELTRTPPAYDRTAIVGAPTQLKSEPVRDWTYHPHLPAWINNLPAATKAKILAAYTVAKYSITGLVLGSLAGGMNEDSA